MAITVKRVTEDVPGRPAAPAQPDPSSGTPQAADSATTDAPARSTMFRSKRPTGAGLLYFPSWRVDGSTPSFASAYGVTGFAPDPPLLRLAALRVRGAETDPGRVFPWVTFVLGSGCLAGETTSESDQASSVHEGVAALVDAAFDAVTLDGLRGSDRAEVAKVLGSPALRELASEFIVELASSRTPGQVGAWLAETQSLESPFADRREFGLLAALGAALGARLYLETTSLTRVTLTSPQRETVTFDPADFPQLHRIDEAVREPLAALVKALNVSALRQEPGVGAFLRVIEIVATDRSVVRERVEVLGAFAWHFLTAGTSVYPGWSDILLFQAAETSGIADFLDVPMLRRPKLHSLVEFGTPDTDAWLVTRLREVTERSWSEHADRVSSERELFYGAVADTLIQQAAVNANPQANAPLATAFIAGFDVELEMSLLRRLAASTDGPREIAVVAPVFHVRPGGGYDTSLCWIWKKVRVDGERPLAELLDGGGWQYNDEKRGRLAGQLRGLPVVVHLSGAPLLTVTGGDIAGLPGWRTQHQIRPALLLDEYTSLIQVALDLRQVDGRLAAELTSDPVVASSRLSCGPRYWAFVGVQLSDPAVRLRLLSHEISTEWGNATDKHRETETLSTADRGVVVNTWSPVSERQLFHWQGFGVVKAEAKEMTADIERLREFAARELPEWVQ